MPARLSLAPIVVVIAACAWVARIVSGAFDDGASAANGALLNDAYPLLAGHVDALVHALRARDGGMWIHGANLGYPAGTFGPLLPSLFAATLHAVGLAGDVHQAIKIALAVPLVLLPATTFAGLRLAFASAPGDAKPTNVDVDITIARWRACAASVVCALVVSGSPYGLGIEGAFASALLDEAWATCFLPLAAGAGVYFIRRGDSPSDVSVSRVLFVALAASILCALCHPIVGASTSIAWLLAVQTVPSAHIGPALRRAVALMGLTLAGTMVMWITPLATWSARGVFGPHLDDGDGGYSLLNFIRFIATALDGGRDVRGARGPPFLTLLALVGVLSTALQTARRGVASAGAPYVAVVALSSLLLLLGPILPLAGTSLPLGRVVFILQLSLCALAGIGLVDVIALVGNRDRTFTTSRTIAFVARASLAFAVVALLYIAASAQLRHARDILRTVESDPTLAADLATLRRVAREATPGTPGRVAAVGGLRTVSRHALAVDGWPGLWTSIGPPVASSSMAPFLSRTDVFDTVTITNTGLLLLPRDAPDTIRPRGRAQPTRAGRFLVYETGVRRFFVPILLEPLAEDADFREQSLTWWKSDGFRTGRHYVEDFTPTPPGKGRVQVISEQIDPSRFSAELDVATDGPRAVLLSVSWHPWWRASVDGAGADADAGAAAGAGPVTGAGAPVRALRVSPDMLAAEVAPGLHTLAFTFVRPMWWWLLWLMPFAALLAARIATRRSSSLLR